MSPETPSKISYNTLQPFLLSLMMIIGIFLGFKINDKQDQNAWIDKFEDNTETIGRVEEVLRFLEHKYVDTIDKAGIIDKAMNAIVEELDPHSIYISPDELKKVNRQMSGNFYGIGVETHNIQDTFYIAQILKQGPVAKLDVKMGDRILMIDDSIVAGKNLSYADLSSLMADKDHIKMQLLRYDAYEPHWISVDQKDIEVNSAEYHFSLDSATAYIELSRFTSKSYTDFMQALETYVKDRQLDKLVLDLRNNPGGYLPEANKMLSQLFSEKDLLMLYTEGSNGAKQEYKTTGKNFFTIHNIAVLIDEGSASGSEILAGAIQDWDRGVVVGRRSFGKGLVQEQYNLKNGGALRLTVARYYIPSGRSIQRSFDDKDEYYNDLYNREAAGELYENSYQPDSAEVYYTKNLKRKVYGGGGVSPDLFVPTDARYQEPDYDNLSSQLADYIFIEYLENRCVYSEEEIFAENCNQLDHLMAFKSTLEPSEQASFDKYEDILIEDVIGFIARYNSGYLLQKRVMAKYDKVILEAQKALSNNDLIVELQ